jgi:CBS domain-containing protein
VADYTVAEIMHRDPRTVQPDEDVRTAIRLLREHELPGLPVVDEGGRLLGIVTESDLVIQDSEADLHLPHFVDLLGGVVFVERLSGFEERLRKAFATKVSEVMTADPVTCRPQETVREAARKIAERKHNRLPVVDDENRVVGVVTRIDVLSALTGEE